jgi:adenylate cyclase
MQLGRGISKRWFGPARLVGLAVLALALALRVFDPGIMETLQLKTFDLYQKLKPRETQRLPVAIIDIDEKSIAQLGQWPWPRTVIAELIEKATAAGAVAVAFDVVFSEPDRLSPALYADMMTGLPEAARDALRQGEQNDVKLAAAMRKSRVILGQSGISLRSAIASGSATVAAPPTPSAMLGPDPRPYLDTYTRVLRNIPVLDGAAAGRGLFSIKPEFDNVVRRLPLVALAEGRVDTSLAMELLRVATGGQAFLLKSDAAGVKSVVVGGVDIPTDNNGRLWVNYTPHRGERFVSAVDVLRGPLPPGRLAGHLLLVGTSAIGLGDLRATPLDPGMPGVEIHAQLLETVLTKTWLTRPNTALLWELVGAAVVSLLIIALVPALGAVRVLALGGALAAALLAGGWYLFAQQRVLIDTFYPLGTSLAVFVAMTFMNYIDEERQRRVIRTAFSRYLSPAMVEQLAQNPAKLELGGETRELTLLFSDVRGFTSISETYRADPQGLTRLMNRFLTPLSNAIIERKGTIDKYMGDAVMAFWNAPLDDAQHALNACDAALEMADRLEKLNAERAAEDAAANRKHIPMRIGIGLNSGHCVVGNMGSDVRFDYSVLGDTVNIASRLEGQTKDYGVTILVGAATAAHAGERFALIEADLLRVKGKTEPERVFTLVGRETVKASPVFGQAKAEAAALHDAYRGQRWDEADAVLASAKALGDLGLADFVAIYRERIRQYRASPPPADWDGVFVATSK